MVGTPDHCPGNRGEGTVLYFQGYKFIRLGLGVAWTVAALGHQDRSPGKGSQSSGLRDKGGPGPAGPLGATTTLEALAWATTAGPGSGPGVDWAPRGGAGSRALGAGPGDRAMHI